MVEQREKLEESIKEIDEANCITYSMDEFREKIGLENEEKDEAADGLIYKITETTIVYEKYCRDKELNKLIKAIERILKNESKSS